MKRKKVAGKKKVTGPNSAPEPTRVTANDLRRLAEKADGLRKQPLHLAVNSDGKVDLVSNAKGLKAWDEVSVETWPAKETDEKGNHGDYTGMGTAPEVELYWKEGESPILLVGDLTDGLRGDSVFWSQAAVEKFLIPYYTRFLDDANLLKLRRFSRKSTVVAIVHREPTIYEEVEFAPFSQVALAPRPQLLVLEIGARGQLLKTIID